MCSSGKSVIIQKDWTIDGKKVNFATTAYSSEGGQEPYTTLQGPGGYGIQFGVPQYTKDSASVAGISSGINSEAKEQRVGEGDQTTTSQSGCSSVSGAPTAGYVRPYVEDAPDETDPDGDTSMSG